MVYSRLGDRGDSDDGFFLESRSGDLRSVDLSGEVSDIVFVVV